MAYLGFLSSLPMTGVMEETGHCFGGKVGGATWTVASVWQNNCNKRTECFHFSCNLTGKLGAAAFMLAQSSKVKSHR